MTLDLEQALNLVEAGKYGVLALGWILFLLERRQNIRKDEKIFALTVECTSVLNAVKERLASRRR